jgi:hypothetical protein
MDKDPSNEAFVLSLLEGYGIDEAEAMETEAPPARKIGEANTSLGLIEGSYPQIGGQAYRQEGQIIQRGRRRAV